MSERHDYGPLISYQITWKSGHIETIQAHQVLHMGGHSDFMRPDMPARVRFHGEFDGRWRLVMDAPGDEIHTIRETEPALRNEDGTP
jgi:hypothetical protein